MVLKKSVHGEEALSIEVAQELTESELTAIHGGSDPDNLAALESLFAAQNSSTKKQAGKGNNVLNSNNLDPLTNLANGLIAAVL